MEEVVGSIPTRSTIIPDGLCPTAIFIPIVLTCVTCVHCTNRDSNRTNAAHL